MAGVGYGFDFAAYEKNLGQIIEDAAVRADARTGGMNKLSRQTAEKVDAELAEREAGITYLPLPYYSETEGIQIPIPDLLTRCLEELRKAHGSDERLQAELDGFNKAIRTAEKNDLDLSLLWIEEAKQISKQLKLRRDIKAALKALQ